MPDNKSELATPEADITPERIAPAPITAGNEAQWGKRRRYKAGVLAVPVALTPSFLLSAFLGVPTPLEPLTEFVMQLTPISAANVLLEALGSFARMAALLGAIAISLLAGGLLALVAPGNAPYSRRGGGGVDEGRGGLPRPGRGLIDFTNPGEQEDGDEGRGKPPYTGEAGTRASEGQRRRPYTDGAANKGRWMATVILSLLIVLPLAKAAAYAGEAWGAILIGILFVPALLLARGLQRRSTLANTDKKVPGTSRRIFLQGVAAMTFTVAGSLALGVFDTWSGAVAGLLGRGEMLRTLFHFTPPQPRKPGFPVTGVDPEVTPVEHFYLIDKNDGDPLIEPDQWSLLITGRVRQPFHLSYAELLAMPRVDQYVTLRCIDNLPQSHLMSTAYWSGVPLATLLERAGPAPGAAAIKIHAPDGYDEVLPFEAATAFTTLLAYGMNGITLPRVHGGPVRLLAPGFYGFKNVKWVESIEVVAPVVPGYWAERGWTAARIHSVARIDAWSLTQHGLLVAGVAFAGAQGVAAVQVRVDSGRWQPAELNIPALSPVSWVQWRIVLPLSPGAYQLAARVIDGRGKPQDANTSNVYPNGATGLHTVNVTVKE
jgi:DMSO/TMAO reductase YedYZ molybdopterin-dependent catalytic subunit